MVSTTPRVVYYPSPEKPLTNEEVAHALAQLGKRDALWLAFMQILQQRLANAATECADAGLSERAAAHASGRMAEIMQLQQEFASYRTHGFEIKKRAGE